MHANRAMFQESRPRNLGGLKPAADRLTDVQVFLQDPGLAKGREPLCVARALTAQFIYSAAYAGSAH